MMKTSLKKIFLLMAVVMTAMVCFMFSVSAATEGYYTYSLSNGEATITKVDTSISGDVTIPSAFGNYTVTSISASAFKNCREITSITIPDSVISIGGSAFKGCTCLEKITIPDSVTSIGQTVFHSTFPVYTSYFVYTKVFCNAGSYAESYAKTENITYVLIDADEETNVITGKIGSRFNWKLSKLTGILTIEGKGAIPTFGDAGAPWKDYEKYVSVLILGEGITEISSENFEKLYCISELHIPSTVKKIRGFLFGGNNDLVSQQNFYSYPFFKSVYSSDIEAWLMIDFDISLSSFSSLHDDVVAPFRYAENLYFGETLAEKIIIPNTVKMIKPYAFVAFESIESVTIPSSVEEIGVQAFAQCSNLKELSIANGVKKISSEAFRECKSLENITIPESVVTIGGYAFLDCNNLKNVFVNNIEAWFKIDFLKAKANPLDNGASLYLKNKLVTDFVVSPYITNVALNSVSLQKVTFALDDKNQSKIKVMPRFGNTKIKEIILPVSIEKIPSGAFPETIEKVIIYNQKCEFNSSCGLDYTHTIYGFKGSTAEKFAGEIGAEFIDVETVHKHSYKNVEDIKPTCIEDGKIVKRCECGKEHVIQNGIAFGHKGGTATCTEKAVCTVCKQSYGSLKSHTYTTTTTKATLSTNGSQVEKCKVCNSIKSKVTVYYPKTIKLYSTTLTYNGKNQTPSVTVKDSKGKTLKKGTDYTVTYSKKRKSIGKYTVTVTFKGNYSGTKKLTFEIVPAKVSLSKVSAGKKQLTATWKTVSGATGYEVVYSTSKKFTKKTTKTVTIKKANTKKTTIKKLKKGKKYYVKVRAYKTVSGKKIYGAYSSVKIVKVK